MVREASLGAFAIKKISRAFMEPEVAIEAALHRRTEYVPLSQCEILIPSQCQILWNRNHTLTLINTVLDMKATRH